MRLGLWLCDHSMFKMPDRLSSLLQINLVHDRDVQIHIHIWSDDHDLQKDVQKKCICPRKNAHLEKWIMSELSDTMLYNLFIVYFQGKNLGCVSEKKESKQHLKLNKLQIILIKIISSHCHSSWAVLSAKRLQASAVRFLTVFFINPGDRERAMCTICHPGVSHWKADRESLLKCHLEKNTQQHPWNLLWERLGTCWAWERKRFHKKSTEKAKTHVKALTNQKKFSYRPLANLIWFLL